MKRFLLLLFLAGCSTKPVYKPITLEIPVPVPCRAPVILHPVWPTQELSEKSTFVERVKAILAENELRRAYETKLEAAIEACR